MNHKTETPWTRAKVFISHNHADKPTARKISVELLQEGHEIWLDEWEMVPGDSLISKINEGLAESSYLLVLLSEDSVDSPWVIRELESALHRQITEKSVTVVPCLLDDCQIPEFLRPIMYADFRSGFEEGMKQLHPAIKPIDLVATGRIKEGEDAYVSDYAFDWAFDESKEIKLFRLEIIHHYILQKQTLRTHFYFEPVGVLRDQLNDIGQEFKDFKVLTFLRAIIESFERAFSEGVNDLNLLIDGADEYNTDGLITSPDGDGLFTMKTSARRLGENVDSLIRVEVGVRIREYLESIEKDIFRTIPPDVVEKYKASVA